MLFIIGTAEVAGLTPVQAVEIVRGLKGLNIIGGDLVEVSELGRHKGGGRVLIVITVPQSIGTHVLLHFCGEGRESVCIILYVWSDNVLSKTWVCLLIVVSAVVAGKSPT